MVMVRSSGSVVPPAQLAAKKRDEAENEHPFGAALRAHEEGEDRRSDHRREGNSPLRGSKVPPVKWCLRAE